MDTIERCAAVDEYGMGRCVLDAHDSPRHAYEDVPGPPGPPQRWQSIERVEAEREALVSDSTQDALAAWVKGVRVGRADVMGQIQPALGNVMADYRTPQGQVQVDYHEQEAFGSEVAAAILAALEATS